MALAAFAYAQQMKPLLQLGIGHGARVACGCRHIGNRPLASRAARFAPLLGCQPGPLEREGWTVRHDTDMSGR